MIKFLVLLISAKVDTAQINMLDCGVDHADEVYTGEVAVQTYPWLGVLYYTDEDMAGIRAVTPVVLIHEEFVIGSAAEIGDMPKTNFRKNSRVLLGENWNSPGRRVRNYVIHPQYGETYNTLAIVQLKDPVRNGVIKPLCPPPDMLKDPEFFVVRFKDDYNVLEKEVLSMYYVPRRMCRDFYVAANLYAVKMRPPHVVCACAVEDDNVCVWEAGSVLVTRDVWGRWLFLGFGVRGPGCGAPSRYLDMLTYYPWIHSSLNKFQRLTISKLSPHKYVLRSGGRGNLQKFGACDDEERINIMFREFIALHTDNNQYQFLTYNLTIAESMEISCLTLELVNASAASEMKVRHFCPRETYGPVCYSYRNSVFDISVYLMFSDKCTFEMFVWGDEKNMTLVDVLEWKWEEGTYYEDFTMQRVEYLGQAFMTSFGFEPTDPATWVPDYDVWSTTDNFNVTTSLTTGLPNRVPALLYFGVEGKTAGEITTLEAFDLSPRRWQRIRGPFGCDCQWLCDCLTSDLKGTAPTKKSIAEELIPTRRPYKNRTILGPKKHTTRKLPHYMD